MDLELVSSQHNSPKNKLEMFAVRCSNILPNLILTLPSILTIPKVQLLRCSNVCDGVTDFEVCLFKKDVKI